VAGIYTLVLVRLAAWPWPGAAEVLLR
jgi:hypothetical protein